MIRLSYSGTLDGFDPLEQKGRAGFWSRWFWTYRHRSVDTSTRSGYFLIQAIKRLRDVYDVTPLDLRVDWWGQIAPMNIKQVSDAGLELFFEHNGYLPKGVSLKRMSMSDLLLLPLEKANISGMGPLFIPGKLYEYIETGKPIFALCEESDCKSILEKSGLGIFAPPDDIEQIASVLLRIIRGDIDLTKLKPDVAYIEGFSFKNKTKELASVFIRCLASNP